MTDFKSFRTNLEEKKGLWDNIHAKRKRGEKPNPPGHPDRPTAQDFKDAQKKESVEEKKLTAAELKKREEIAKAMERDNPGMDMSKKMAIATATAKRVAEQSLDEKVYASDYNVGAEKSQFGGYTPVVTHKKTGRTMYSAQHSYKKPEHAKGHASAYLNGYQAMGDRHADRKAREYATQNQKHQYVKESLDISEISLDMLTKKISNSGMDTTKKANKMDKTKNDLAALRARLAGKPAMAKESVEELDEKLDHKELKSDFKSDPDYRDAKVHKVLTTHKAEADVMGHHSFDTEKGKVPVLKRFDRGQHKPKTVTIKKGQKLVHDGDSDYYGYSKKHGHFRVPSYNMNRDHLKEAYEDNEPASPDEASMAMRQLGFIEYAAEEVMDHIKSGKEFPEWMQNKLSKLHGQMESLHSALGEHGEDDEDEMKEATELDELNKKTLGSYVKKASGSAAGIAAVTSAQAAIKGKSNPDDRRQLRNRLTGISRATDKVTKEEVANEALSNNMRLISKIKNSGVVKTGSMAKDTKPAPKKEVDEAKCKGAPKMTGDSVAIQRAKDAALNKALGRTKTGRKTPTRTMTSTQRSLASLRNEGVNTADKKPEKFVKPDGTVGIRMVPVDKQIVDKDK